MHDTLRERVRKRMHREPSSTVAIADSQSVKTTEKRERSTAMTAARRCKGASGILLSIRKGG